MTETVTKTLHFWRFLLKLWPKVEQNNKTKNVFIVHVCVEWPKVCEKAKNEAKSGQFWPK